MTVGQILRAVQALAPRHMAFADDPIGLQVGDLEDAVSKCVVALDATPSAIVFAAGIGAQAMVSHHPPIFHPLRSLAGSGYAVRVAREALARGIALIAAHTNWDTAEGGVNDTLAKMLDLVDVRPFGDDISAKAYKLVTFVPDESLDTLLNALADAGAGEIGLYRRCAFYHQGSGTYEPQEGAQPLIGEVGERETTPETRLEMRLPGHALCDVEQALRESHPYDEPAYDIWEVANAGALSLPRMGLLPEPLPFHELRSYVDRALNCRARSYGDSERKVSSLAVVGGTGGSYWEHALRAGCDVLVTGEVRHHEAVEAAEVGLCVVEAGHYHTEYPGMAALRDRLAELVSGVESVLYEPVPGSSGRPV